ncbi:metal-dependent hydrolase [Haloarchaeobius sp. DFWS5]|uniref:metal-dependent hydrolase n=1 Tax=Haloarchaeobius sp. DFWS5 TaxID=3446114 RepID=UPI003EBC8911
MVDVLGHLGMAMLWAAPAWFVWERRVSAAFVGFALLTAMLPDTDLVLRQVLPVTHHGVTHTVVFVVAVALVVGPLLAIGLQRVLTRVWLRGSRRRFTRLTLVGFVVAGLLVGGLSHLFADMLSAPDIAKPVQPFWPFFEKPWSVDVVWYNAPWINSGLFAFAALLNLGLAYFDVGPDRRLAMYHTISSTKHRR